jgi:ATP synthase in type III secretion protein N
MSAAAQAGERAEFAAGLRLLRARVSGIDTRVPAGTLVGVSGPLVRAELPAARIGEVCELRNPDTGDILLAEVVGLEGHVALMAPYSATAGLSIRTEVITLGRTASVLVGDHLLGRAVDSAGRELEAPSLLAGRAPGADAQLRPIAGLPPPPLTRRLIERPLAVGIRAIDGLITCGEGQRVGIFGSAGVGKSTLIAQIVQQAEADIVVVGLVGERGREVGEFVERTLAGPMRQRSVVVVATSDRPPVERVQAALVATSIAEHYRDRGKRVLLVIDSVTRLARALRDIALAAGEPPARRGFPPSVFSALPLLFERAGTGTAGSITAFYTVLVEGDPMADPIVEESKSLLDGHIMLSDRLASAAQFPAIDVLESRSRVMSAVVSGEHQRAARRIVELMARYRDIELLLQVGEYQQGVDAVSDEAVRKHDAIRAFLNQSSGAGSTLADALAGMTELIA